MKVALLLCNNAALFRRNRATFRHFLAPRAGLHLLITSIEASGLPSMVKHELCRVQQAPEHVFDACLTVLFTDIDGLAGDGHLIGLWKA